MTTYDDIWQTFVDNCMLTDIIPTTDESRYILIHNGIKRYNSSVSGNELKLTYDDTLEIINTTLDDTRLLLLAYCIRYTFLENELISFEQIWQSFSKDVGIKFYGDQIKGREATLQRTKQEISQLLLNIESYSFLE